MSTVVLIIGAGVIAAVAALARKREHAELEPRCGNCRYNVPGLPTSICPECGSDLRQVGIIRGRPGPYDTTVRRVIALAAARQASRRGKRRDGRNRDRRLAAWTPSEERQLANELRADVTIDQIADANWRAPRAISEQIRRLRARGALRPRSP